MKEQRGGKHGEGTSQVLSVENGGEAKGGSGEAGQNGGVRGWVLPLGGVISYLNLIRHKASAEDLEWYDYGVDWVIKSGTCSEEHLVLFVWLVVILVGLGVEPSGMYCESPVV